MITDQMKAEGSLWDVTQDLLSRFSKASKKGTGLRLSADDVFILSLTGFGHRNGRRPVMRRLRYWIGRHLVHLGLRIMPQGRVRSELYQLLDEWGTRVFAAIEGGR